LAKQKKVTAPPGAHPGNASSEQEQHQKQQSPQKRALSRAEKKPELLQLHFLVLHMLASLGIKFHDRHFLGHGFLVLAGGVEVTGTGRGFQLDLFASAFGGHGAAPVQ
jgi:hypothetical protein